MNLDHLFKLAIPAGAVALLVLVGVLIGLNLLQRSLQPDFPLARKLFPATAVLIGFLTARSLVAGAHEPSVQPLKVVLSLGIVWTMVYLVSRAIWVLTQLLFKRFEIEQVDNLRARRIRTQLQFIEKLGYVVVTVLGAGSTLLLFEAARHFGQSLLASAGVAGIIVGFAAQKSLSNLIAGFQIAFTQPVRIEDVVVVENEWGWVEEINLTYVVIRVWDRRRLILPITYLVEKPFQNWTRTTSHIIGAVMIDVSHQVDVAKVEAELFRLLEATPLWDQDVRVLQVVEAGPRSVTLRALMTAKDSPTCWDLRCLVRRGLVEFIQAHHPEALPIVRLDHDVHDVAAAISGERMGPVPQPSLSLARGR
ncbi:MAG: mechanosensitive ion channel domain-containing protein [Polyangiales bacterium]